MVHLSVKIYIVPCMGPCLNVQLPFKSQELQPTLQEECVIGRTVNTLSNLDFIHFMMRNMAHLSFMMRNMALSLSLH